MAEQQFIPLVLIVVVAFFVPILVTRIPGIKIPPIVAEIVMGIILGKSGFNLIREVPPIDFLAAFGFIFLMFLSGFDIDFSIMSSGRGRKKNLAMPLLIFLSTLALAFASSFAVTKLGMVKDNFLFALILSTTSVGIVLPVIKENAETQTHLGQSLIITALIADIITILLLTIYVVYYSKGVGTELFLMVGLFVLFFIVFGMLRLLLKIRIVTRIFDELAHASTQIKIRGGLALLIIFVVLSESIGVEAILGAFIAGLFLSLLITIDKEVTSMKLDAIGYGFFIPIFFVMVGARLDLPTLFSSPRSILLVPLLLVLAYAVKILPSLLLTFNFTLRESLAGGLLISSRLALIVAASEIALSLGIIDNTVNSATVLVAIFTSIASPILYNRVRGERKLRKPKVVIAGAGRVGRELYERVALHTPDVKLIEKDPDQIRKVRSELKHPIIGNCMDLKTLKKAGMNPTDVFVALTGSDEINLRSCMSVKRHFGVSRVIARDNNPKNTEKFSSEGVIPLNLTTSIAVAAENMVIRPSLVQLFESEKEGLSAFEVIVKNPAYFNVKIKDIKEIHDALILLVKTGDEIAVAHGDTVIREDDSIVACGLPEDEFRLRTCFEKE